MRFFLDTADPEEARRVRDWGLLDGILLRPESAEMKGRDARRVLADLAQVGDGPVVATLASGDPKAMYKEARELHKHGKNVVLRVPMTREACVTTEKLLLSIQNGMLRIQWDDTAWVVAMIAK